MCAFLFVVVDAFCKKLINQLYLFVQLNHNGLYLFTLVYNLFLLYVTVYDTFKLSLNYIYCVTDITLYIILFY